MKVQCYGLIVLISLFCERSHGEVAPVKFTFTVEPTNGMFMPVYKTDEARKEFPDEDILITQMSFKGVYLDGGDEVVPFHDSLKIEYSETLDFVFHHTLLHQGSADETYEKWAHFTEKDTTTWSHGAIMFGTSLKTTSFKPFGTRLHKDVADIYACIHAKNNKDYAVDMIAEWEVVYEVVNSPQADPRAMVVGWFSLPYFDPNEDAETEDTSVHVLVETDLVMHKDARLLGWVIHYHKWLYEIDLKVSNRTFFAVGKGADTDPIPTSDGVIHWLKSDNYDYEKDREVIDENNNTVVIVGDHDINEFGYDVSVGEALQMEVIATNPTKQTKGPLGISLYFQCNDGTERLQTFDELFSPPHDHGSLVDPEMNKKVDDWNKYLITSLKKKQIESKKKLMM